MFLACVCFRMFCFGPICICIFLFTLLLFYNYFREYNINSVPKSPICGPIKKNNLDYIYYVCGVACEMIRFSLSTPESVECTINIRSTNDLYCASSVPVPTSDPNKRDAAYVYSLYALIQPFHAVLETEGYEVDR